jgi:hypothetical protein
MKRLSPHLDLFLYDIDGEEWRDVIGYDGIYNISNFGRVKSLRRYSSINRIIKEKILKQQSTPKGQTYVGLSIDGVVVKYTIAVLVADAFMRDRNEGECICKKNKVAHDNRLSNLLITNFSESVCISYKLGNLSDWGIGQLSKNVKSEHDKIFNVYEGNILARRVCVSCMKELPILDFYGKGDGFNRKCKDCFIKRMGVVEVGKNKLRAENLKAGLKTCWCCKETKSVDTEFTNKNKACKNCQKEKNAQYNKNRMVKMQQVSVLV